MNTTRSLTEAAMIAAAERITEEAAARETALAQQVDADTEQLARQAHEEWLRRTRPLREDAAALAERVLEMPADPDAWTVCRDSDTTAHMEMDGLAFTAYPLLSQSGSRLALGVRRAGSSDRLRELASLADLGDWLAQQQANDATGVAPDKTK